MLSPVKPFRPSFPFRQKAYQELPDAVDGTDGISKIITGRSNP